MIIYKNDEQVDLIRQSCKIVNDAIAEIARLIRPGITTMELNDRAEEYIRDHGAVPNFKNYEGFPFACCMSVNDAVVHGFPTNDELKDGDVISVDVGALKNKYHGDSAYTFAFADISDDIKKKKLTFIIKDIYDTSAESLGGKFDIIILKDVIEHIHDQSKLLERLKDFLNKDGIIFFGFPPWQMPFGGHQQLSQSSLSKIPYFHLFPRPVYKGILKLFKEKDHVVNDLLEIKDTGISIERFEKIVKKTNYKVVDKIHYLFNPIYEYKFNIKPKKQNKLVSKIPYLRDYFTTCVYYIIKSN